MSGDSSIQWTNKTWNFVIGCKRKSRGCDNCYAFALHDKRHVAWKRGRWPDAPAQYHLPFSKVQVLPERLTDPLHWREPRMIFVNSMSDLWHDDVPDDILVQAFGVMAATPQHTYQILTKRPERMLDWMARMSMGIQGQVKLAATKLLASQPPATEKRLRKGLSKTWVWPLPNVWLGVSVEDQQAADERVPLLLQTPAAVRFLSCEPLLGPVDLIGDPDDGAYGPIWHKRSVQTRTDYGTGVEWDVELESGIDWCIIGGESGPHARPMNPEWACSLVEQCRAAGIAPFVKQLGSVWAKANHAHDHHGGDVEEWPEALRIREFPPVREAVRA